MRIIDNRTKSICFGDLDYGDCLVDEYNDVYMKAYISGTPDNAIKLSDGKSYLFGDDEVISPINAELVIY